VTFENEVYHEARRCLPRVGSRVRCPDGSGTVRKLDLLANLVSVSVPGVDGLLTFPADRLAWDRGGDVPAPRGGARGCGRGGPGREGH